MRELSAIQALTRGNAGVQDWKDLADMLNLCETMARGGVGPEALESCETAQRALVETAKRYEATKKLGITAEGLRALRDVFEYHDLQRQSVSRGQYEKWVAKTHARIRSGAPEAVDIREIA